MVLDKDLGPMMLELNARPGLNIQIANDTGLSARCQAVEAEIERLAKQGLHNPPPEQRLAFCQSTFANAQCAALAKELAEQRAAQEAADEEAAIRAASKPGADDPSVDAGIRVPQSGNPPPARQ